MRVLIVEAVLKEAVEMTVVIEMELVWESRVLINEAVLKELVRVIVVIEIEPLRLADVAVGVAEELVAVQFLIKTPP